MKSCTEDRQQQEKSSGFLMILTKQGDQQGNSTTICAGARGGQQNIKIRQRGGIMN